VAEHAKFDLLSGRTPPVAKPEGFRASAPILARHHGVPPRTEVTVEDSTSDRARWSVAQTSATQCLELLVRTRVGSERGRIRRISIVAVDRKLLVALWRYLTQGEVPKGAVLKTA
jgi:hypothetical protein